MKNKNLSKIIKFLQTKKTSFFKLIDISKISSLVDYFLIISMNNIKAVDSVTDDLLDFLYKEDIEIRKIDGKNTPWIIIDCYDYMIHIFNEEERKYYDLSKNWADGIDINI